MKVLCFGSINIDYVYDVPHFVQPGETLSAKSMNIFAGGKGMNQASAMKRAGVDVYFAGCIGNDGQILKEMLQENGFGTELLSEKEERSGHTIIQVNEQGQNCILYYGGANRSITKEQIDKTLQQFKKGDFLVLQNEIVLLDYLIEQAYEKGMKTVLNPSPIDEAINRLPLEKVQYFVVNEVEGACLCGHDRIEDMIATMSEKYPNAKILLTLGSDGARYFDGEQTYSQPIFKVQAVDTTAAGDTFLGYFIYGLSNSLPVQQTLRLSAKASSITVSRKGAVQSIPTLGEVQSALEREGEN